MTDNINTAAIDTTTLEVTKVAKFVGAAWDALTDDIVAQPQSMSTEELAILCKLLNKYYTLVECSGHVKGLVDCCYFAAWEAGVKRAGSVWKFHRAMQRVT